MTAFSSNGLTRTCAGSRLSPPGDLVLNHTLHGNKQLYCR